MSRNIFRKWQTCDHEKEQKRDCQMAFPSCWTQLQRPLTLPLPLSLSLRNLLPLVIRRHPHINYRTFNYCLVSECTMYICTCIGDALYSTFGRLLMELASSHVYHCFDLICIVFALAGGLPLEISKLPLARGPWRPMINFIECLCLELWESAEEDRIMASLCKISRVNHPHDTICGKLGA